MTIKTFNDFTDQLFKSQYKFFISKDHKEDRITIEFDNLKALEFYGDENELVISTFDDSHIYKLEGLVAIITLVRNSDGSIYFRLRLQLVK